MDQANGGVDETVSHGTISHGVISNAFNRESPTPPPTTQIFWVDDDGNYWITDDDDFFISTDPI
jgi:hypothetical protein